ncbi:8063_t:CDS:2 [Funneliformis geosporum]|uniref:rRNA adenine N(6)-methyltransferase n=1 Tax=Funneliformis geosporum TaxID=1117311 RepID=A0A9W4T2S8_9GLOM|nr:8063_t:CDS:2 [Funneliformis geosporum]
MGKQRVSLNDMKVAIEAVKILKVPNDSTIVEISPGVGFLTHALLHSTNARKIIALENDKKYVNELSTLVKESDGRLEILNIDVYKWDTYDHIKSHLSHIKIHPWEEVHPNLISLIHLPNTSRGEISINKLLSNCYNKSGLHSFGRSRMNFFAPEKAAEKILAKEGELQRHKLKIELEAIADIEVLKIFPEKAFYPNIQCALFGVTPLVEPRLQGSWLTFEFVIKTLMSRKNAKVIEMLSTLGAGANTIAKDLSFDLNMPVRNMTAENYSELSIIFDKWPFKPDYIDDIYIPPPKHKKRW